MVDERNRSRARAGLMRKLGCGAGKTLSRRDALKGVGLGLGLLAACGDESSPIDTSTSGTGGDGAGSAGTGGTGGSTATGSSTSWALGGTAAMLAAASYPNPFETAPESCTLTCILTQGPCWAPSAPLRQDISEGEPGIPLRLMLRVVDADGCTPVSGAEVEIWYCNIDGLYSAEDVQNPGFCTGDDEHALESYFFRGRALCDDAGVVTFDGCFPGWYPSRSIHIHVLVRPAAAAGAADTSDAVAISQLFFPEALTAEIFDTVGGYVEHGQPDTSFESDNVLGSVDDITPYVVEYDRMSDGAMLAWKTISISTTESCGSSDGGGGGPGGGPPPEGGGPPGGAPPGG